MVRKNDNLPETKGFDQEQSPILSEELEKTGHARFETAYPEAERYERNLDPIDIRADVGSVDKEG
ncbi:MAG TPA: hypothetical protein VFX15_03070 [Actinomycetes bacterium]|nr:hypothetical protein [Actinomycetes bacterium]